MEKEEINDFPYLANYFKEHPGKVAGFVEHVETGRQMGREKVLNQLIAIYLDFYNAHPDIAKVGADSVYYPAETEKYISIPYQMIITVLDEYCEEKTVFSEDMPFERMMEYFYPGCAYAFEDGWRRTCIFDAVLQWTFPSISMEVIEKYRDDEDKCAALCYGLWIRVGFDDGFFYRRITEPGLAVSLYLDDSGFWSREDCWGRPVIKFQPNANKWHHLIVMSVDDDPQILTEYIPYDLPEAEVDKIKQYVKNAKWYILDTIYFNNSIYETGECVVFNKTKALFGGLSNMAAGYPLDVIKGFKILTVEALFQACRYPDYPDIQQQLFDCKSPVEVKMKSKKYRKQFSRPDWERVKNEIMYWCISLKLSHNKEKFGELLKSTEGKMIVEDNAKDRYWGAKRNKDNPNVLSGCNTMGKLLMRLRDEWRQNPGAFHVIKTPDIPNFKLLGKTIERDHCSEMRIKYALMMDTMHTILND
jgi:ribA/ribD-fused uncharacterized protein